MKGERHDKRGRSRRGRGRVDEPFVQLNLSLLAGPAFSALSVNASRILFRLIAEHLRHAGRENGRLSVTYGQFVEAGCTRELIKDALEELQALGMVEITVQGGIARGEKVPSLYRLTFLKHHDGSAPTNDYKKLNEEQVRGIKEDLKAARKARADYVEQRRLRKSADLTGEDM